MAGGKGSRMKTLEEKPLITIGGKVMIEYVIEALKRSRMIKKIYVAITKSNPMTVKFVSKLAVQMVITPGLGYITDLQYIYKKFNLQKTLIVSSDLPLLTSKIIDDIILFYQMSYPPSLTVVVPSWKYNKLGLSARYCFQYKDLKVCTVGINIIDGKYIDSTEIEEEVLVLDQVEPFINVNTIQDQEIATALLI